MTAQPKLIMPLVTDATLDHWLNLHGLELLAEVLSHSDSLRIAVTSSFGSESAVLLDLVAQVNKATPVIFVDTGRLFAATTDYRDRLAEHLGLSNVQTLKAPDLMVKNADPDGTLFETDPDACCHVRKVMPYAQALSKFDVLIGGRKRHHGDERSKLETVELSGPHIKVNPLAHFSAEDIRTAFSTRNLPPHPLVQEGYSSLGCEPCTLKSCEVKNVRAGRWKGRKKTECGIHFADNRVYESLTDSGL
ncbi:MAG: phosphoadenylyl-sulfate reductase [Rhodospirillaceae bacterium]|nr:MAG: phosphoadenylyl-sulfate reductase [Rhodospirillaceae bacterium]